MNKILIALVVLLSTTAALADGRADDIERLQNGATVIHEIMSAPDSGVPDEIISGAKCIAVIPSMLKAAFGVGGAYGKGVASCRTETVGARLHSSPSRAAASASRSADRPPTSSCSL